jgi:hypothetical protein
MIEVAYDGRERCVVWVRCSSGAYLGRDYFQGLLGSERARFQVLFERLGDFGRIVDAGKYRNENDGLWCLKTISGHRLVTFQEGRLIGITHGFFKRADRFSPEDRRRALLIRADYLAYINASGETR